MQEDLGFLFDARVPRGALATCVCYLMMRSFGDVFACGVLRWPFLVAGWTNDPSGAEISWLMPNLGGGNKADMIEDRLCKRSTGG